MGEIKVNFRFNLVKLVTLQALSLRPGQLFDARQVCALTGLRYSTVSSHLAYWPKLCATSRGARSVFLSAFLRSAAAS